MRTLNMKTIPNNPQLTYYSLHDSVVAFSTTRHGGCSIGNYSSFNINEYCGDNADNIAANRQSLCSLLGIEGSKLVMPHQTHGTNVRQIAEEFFSLPDNIKKMLLEDVDAVMTNVKGICIGVSTADCVPIIIYDPQHQAACVVHAGWRGTVARIIEQALKAMTLAYHTNLADLKVVIGPSISLDSFEVGDEVYQQFAEKGFPMDTIARKMGDKWHIDLWECNKLLLESFGVPSVNIHVDGECTFANPDKYFSARRLGIQSGRIFTGVMIK